MKPIIRLAIVRFSHSQFNTNSYNIQEIGLSKGLTNQNISTDIYSRFSDIQENTNYYSNNGCTIRLIPIKGFALFNRITFFPGLSRILIKERYDIVQVHEDSQLMTPIILKRCHMVGIKTILYQGMYIKYRGINRIYQMFLDLLFIKSIKKNCDIFIAKTELAKEYLENKGFEKIKVISIGLELKSEKSYSHAEEIKVFKSKHNKLLLYVGNIEKRRNPLFLIDILVSLKKNYPSNIGMIVIGKGPLLKKMIQYSENKDISEHILFINSIPNNEIHEIYKNCDIFLLPTNNEIYGMVIMEALLYGLPVISTPEAGPLSILSDDRLGCCLPLNLDSWQKNILKYIKQDNVEDKGFRHQTIKNNYDWNKIAKQYYSTVSSL